MLPDGDLCGKKEEGQKFCPSISLVSLEESGEGKRSNLEPD